MLHCVTLVINHPKGAEMNKTYTAVRIHRASLDKLRKLANTDLRSTPDMLEHLIDEETDRRNTRRAQHEVKHATFDQARDRMERMNWTVEEFNFIFSDWSNMEEHLDWLMLASEQEIFDWITALT